MVNASRVLISTLLLLSSGIVRAADSIETLRSQTALAPITVASLIAQQAAANPAVPPPAPALNQEQDARGNVAQPDFNFTPGNLCTPADPNFKEYRYPEHIAYCNRNVSKEMKLQVAAHYNVPQTDWTKYEFDHLVPLGIGGDSSIDNLWPQPRGGSDSDGKDKLENDLYNQMAAGTITQKAAVQKIYDWFKKYMSSHPELRNTPAAAAVS